MLTSWVLTWVPAWITTFSMRWPQSSAAPQA